MMFGIRFSWHFSRTKALKTNVSTQNLSLARPRFRGKWGDLLPVKTVSNSFQLVESIILLFCSSLVFFHLFTLAMTIFSARISTSGNDLELESDTWHWRELKLTNWWQKLWQGTVQSSFCSSCRVSSFFWTFPNWMLECIIAMHAQLLCKHAGKGFFNRKKRSSYIFHIFHVRSHKNRASLEEGLTAKADLLFLHLAFLLRNPELFRRLERARENEG